MYDLLNDIDSDIASLQKTHFVSNKEVNYDARGLGSSHPCFSRFPYFRGVTVLFKKNISLKILNQHRSDDCRKPFLYSSNDENVILVSDLNCDTISEKDKSSKLKD